MTDPVVAIENHFRDGDHEAVVESCNEYLENLPRHTYVLFIRGMAYESLGQTDEALADYEAVLKINPDYHAAAFKHASCLYGQFRLREALDEFNALAERQPEWIEVFRERANVHLVRQDYEAVAADLERVIELGGETADVRYQRFMAMNVYADYKDSYRELERAIELDPENEEYRKESARNHPDLEKRVKHLKWILNKHPDDIDTENYLLLVLWDLGRMDEMHERISAIERRLGELPGIIHETLAFCYFDKKEYILAASHIDIYVLKVGMSELTNSRALSFGETYFKADRFADAELFLNYKSSQFSFEKTLYKEHDYEIARHSWLARCKLRQGQLAEARKIYEHALELAKPYADEESFATDILHKVGEELKERP